MTRAELLERLQRPEDNFVERKPQGVNRSDIRRTLVAFANSLSAGGEAVLFIGVRDNGEIEGCANVDAKQKDVRSAGGECYPPISPICEVLQVDGLDVLAVVVGATADRPHFSGAAYVRRGSESVAASKEIFDDLVHSRNSRAAAVLELKGQVVTVISLRHKLGQVRHISDSGYRERAECRVEHADAQVVRLVVLATCQTATEPLEHVTVHYDHERGRPMLVVSGYD